MYQAGTFPFQQVEGQSEVFPEEQYQLTLIREPGGTIFLRNRQGVLDLPTAREDHLRQPDPTEAAEKETVKSSPKNLLLSGAITLIAETDI